MRVAVFSSKPYDRQFLTKAGQDQDITWEFLEPRLTSQTVALAGGFDAVSVFVNDVVNRAVIEALVGGGTTFAALRSAGFNHVDLDAAREHGLIVTRVPAYSPYAVAEHTIGLILALNRKLHKAYARVRDNNFSLDGLLGFDLHGKTVGVIGTGQIGGIVAKLAHGFGCEVLLYDVKQNEQMTAFGRYTSLDDIYKASHIITLHCPLLAPTYHLINADAIAAMRDGVMLVNTSRGGLVDTRAVIDGLKRGKIGSLALDVYEEESELFFEDRSQSVIQDDQFTRLLTFPNVLITSHQAFFTQEALTAIAETSVANLVAWREGRDPLPNRVD